MSLFHTFIILIASSPVASDEFPEDEASNSLTKIHLDIKNSSYTVSPHAS